MNNYLMLFKYLILFQNFVNSLTNIDQNKISYLTISPTSRTALALVRTHDLHCVRSHCVFKHIDIHLERLLNETGQSRSCPARATDNGPRSWGQSTPENARTFN